jgi:hypothetical protein
MFEAPASHRLRLGEDLPLAKMIAFGLLAARPKKGEDELSERLQNRGWDVCYGHPVYWKAFQYRFDQDESSTHR